MKTRKSNGEGSCRKIAQGKYECVVQSNLINPKTLKPKRFMRRGATEKEARTAATMAMQAWEKEYRNNGNDINFKKTKLFGEYMTEYMENKVKGTITDSGYYSYYKNMERYFHPYKISKFQLQNLSVKAFQDYYDEIGQKYSKKTCSLPVQLCRRLCKDLVNRSLIPEDYASQALPKKEVIDEYNKERQEAEAQKKEIFSKEDVIKFYNEWKSHLHNSQYDVVAVFLLETGLRAQEFAALQNSDIDLEKSIITIKRSMGTRFVDEDGGRTEAYLKVPKNKKQRIIYLSDIAKKCIVDMQQRTATYCEENKEDLLYPVFRKPYRARSNSTMEVGFKTLCNFLEIDRGVQRGKSGIIKGLCLHSLRHTFITYANTANGNNSLVVSMMAGHQQRVDENIYTHENIEAMSQIQTPSKLFIEDAKPKHSIEISDKDYQEFLEFKRWKEQQEKNK
ncbi:MAG: tyrosine-type recombinase/integrase [Lachnospiraceae bacterium]|nr:tyrosine-type recombinase/integrase [Lachnospiraceae bacterium]